MPGHLPHTSKSKFLIKTMSDPLISKAPGTMGKLIVIQAVPVKNDQNQVIGAIALSREGYF
jgi:hypothetical protein